MKFFISFPPGTAPNPFVGNLVQNLELQGWYERRDRIWGNWRAMWNLRKEVDILHFHWPESFWRTGNPVRYGAKIIWFILLIYLFKALGYKIVFSLHNLLPHKRKEYLFFMERPMRYFLLLKSDLLVAHSYNALEEFEHFYRMSLKFKSVLAIHGCYDNYLNEVETPVANEQLIRWSSLSDSKTLFLLYSPEAYKGCADFITEFSACDTHGIRLLIGGNLPQQLQDVLHSGKVNFEMIFQGKASSGSSFMDEALLAECIKFSDYVVLPYMAITCSGLFFLAVTFLKPVLATRLPFFVQHTNAHTAVLYDRGNLTSLREALNEIRKNKSIGKENLKWLRSRYSLREAAQALGQAYTRITKQ